jgi:hypothetical protein
MRCHNPLNVGRSVYLPLETQPARRNSGSAEQEQDTTLQTQYHHGAISPLGGKADAPPATALHVGTRRAHAVVGHHSTRAPTVGKRLSSMASAIPAASGRGPTPLSLGGQARARKPTGSSASPRAETGSKAPALLPRCSEARGAAMAPLLRLLHRDGAMSTRAPIYERSRRSKCGKTNRMRGVEKPADEEPSGHRLWECVIRHFD